MGGGSPVPGSRGEFIQTTAPLQETTGVDSRIATFRDEGRKPYHFENFSAICHHLPNGGSLDSDSYFREKWLPGFNSILSCQAVLVVVVYADSTGGMKLLCW